MKKTITQWLYMEFDHHWLPNGETDYGEKKWAPVVYRYKGEDNEERIFVRAIQIEVDVPDNFDPTGKVIAALEAKKLKALEAYQGLVAEINERISKLQAITYDAETA